MKELSIEEKAKAYDKALAIARDFYNSTEYAKSHAEVKAAYEAIFPELKESEDERIKSCIAVCLTDCNQHRFKQYSVNIKDCLAWLEKQGEQKPSTDFSDIRTWKYIVDAVLTEKEGIGQYLDSPFTEEIAKKLQKRFGNIEQKLAWSEDDEEKLSDVIFFVREYQIPTRDKRLLNAAKEAEDWLKELKDRYTWKPSDE